MNTIAAKLRELGWTENGAVLTRRAPVAAPHVHGACCSFDVCGVGPTREALVRTTLLRRLDRGEEFWHYKKAEVEAMRDTSAGLPAVPVHGKERNGTKHLSNRIRLRDGGRDAR